MGEPLANPSLESDRRFDTVSISFPDRRLESRRRFRRFLLSLPVSCRDRTRLVESSSIDIGLGGISLLTDQSKVVGDELILQFSFSRDLYVEFHGEVIHAAEGTEPRRQASLGLQFIRGTDTERKALASYLAGVANMAIPSQASWVPGLNWHRSEFLGDRIVTVNRQGQDQPSGMPGGLWQWESQVQDEFVRAVVPSNFSESGLRLTTVEATIHHVGGTQYDRTARLRLKVMAMKRATIVVRFEYLHPQNGMLIAEGQQIFAFVNPNGRLIPIPTDFLTVYRQRYI